MQKKKKRNACIPKTLYMLNSLESYHKKHLVDAAQRYSIQTVHQCNFTVNHLISVLIVTNILGANKIV